MPFFGGCELNIKSLDESNIEACPQCALEKIYVDGTWVTLYNLEDQSYYCEDNQDGLVPSKKCSTHGLGLMSG